NNPHFAGNLNIFVGGRAVERHLAQALRIYPGRRNLAMFVVGSGPDSYAFRLLGDGAGWDARLYDATQFRSITVEPRGQTPIVEDEWIDVDQTAFMMLTLTPPEGCCEGAIEVHVAQRSTREEAVVEFSFDPSAAGPGCFVVG